MGTASPATEASPAGAASPFEHQVPEGHVKTVSSVLGEIVWLMSQSPLHISDLRAYARGRFYIEDLEWPGAKAANP